MTGPGRPPVGPVVEVRFPPELLAEIDDVREGMARAEWIRCACQTTVNMLRKTQL